MSNYFITLEQSPYLFNYFLAKVLLLVNEIVEHGSLPIKKERWELGYNYLFIFETDH